MLSLELVCISKIPLTKEILRKTRVLILIRTNITQIGNTVSHIDQESQVKRIQTKANNLVTQWRREMGELRLEESHVQPRSRAFPEPSVDPTSYDQRQNKK